MAFHPYLRPTVTQRIRTFLVDVGADVPPWKGADEVMDYLWETLYSRRDDAAFWKKLESLIAAVGQDLAAGRRRRLPDPHAEILGDREIEDILSELRAALGQVPVPGGPGVMKRFSHRLGAPLMGCILLLGSALLTGCTSEVGEDALEVLNGYVDDSGLPAGQKLALKQCFVGLSEARKDELVELFKTKTAEEIAAELEAMLEPDGICYQSPADADVADVPPDPTNDDTEDVPAEELPPPDIAPPYKGVTF